METLDGILTQKDFDEIYMEIINLEVEQHIAFSEERALKIKELKKQLGID
ncbi:MAG: hypothetical protein VB012_05840 [Erysipelotrichaceae bacterium]|nr:hypothetical protein [Erysipelotrichaceae bacterium]